jgi:hypothetical protein
MRVWRTIRTPSIDRHVHKVAYTVLVLSGCLAFSSGTVAQTGKFDRQAWLHDYVILKQTLERQYSNLAWFASVEGGVDLPALNRRTVLALKHAKSDDEARDALSAFVTGFHGGHFRQLGTLAPSADAIAEPEGFPYSREDPAGGCAALGYAPKDVPFSLQFESLRGFHLLSDGVEAAFRAGVLTTEDSLRLGLIRIPSFNLSSFPALCVKAWTQPSVWDEKGQFKKQNLREAVDRAWYQIIAEVLQQFKQRGVAAVLVDVGRNGGGGDQGDIGARLFSSLPLRSEPLWVSQDLKASGPYFDEQIKALEEASDLASDTASKQIAEHAVAAFKSQKTKLSGSVCSMTWVWSERHPWIDEPCRRLVEAGTAGGPVAYLSPDSVPDMRIAEKLHWPSEVRRLWGTWTGPVYVLIDSRTYSAAELFASELQNNRAAKLIGDKTGGDGCGFMNDVAPIELPHSHLRFQMPNCVRIRADGTDEVAGVAPDIAVVAREGENSRKQAARVLRALTNDLKSSSARR